MSGNSGGNARDNRNRGNAAQLLEKYKSMARDAQLAGDRVQTEYYLQFADHYFRVLEEGRARFEEQNPGARRRREEEEDADDEEMGFDGDGHDGEGGDGDDGEDDGDTRHQQRPRRDQQPRGDRTNDRGDRYERNDRPERSERPQRAERDERPARDDRPREDRPREDRPREDRAPRDDAFSERAPREHGPVDEADRGPPRDRLKPEETVWFRINIGRDRNADPRWLIPLICKAGGITKAEIGSIRIFDTDTRFQIAKDKADDFGEQVKGKHENNTVITPAFGDGAQAIGAVGGAVAGRNGPPAGRGSDRPADGAPFKKSPFKHKAAKDFGGGKKDFGAKKEFGPRKEYGPKKDYGPRTESGGKKDSGFKKEPVSTEAPRKEFADTEAARIVSAATGAPAEASSFTPRVKSDRPYAKPFKPTSEKTFPPKGDTPFVKPYKAKKKQKAQTG